MISKDKISTGVVDVPVAGAGAAEQELAYPTLEQRVEERTHEIERRQEVAENMGDTLALLNSSRSQAELLQGLIVQARRLFRADCAIIFNLDARRSLLTLQASDGAPPGLLANYQLPLGMGAVGQAVLKREPVVITDTHSALATILEEHDREDESQLRETLQRLVRYYGAVLAMPLIIRDEIYGGISLYYAEQHEFADEDLKLAGMFAHQTALAIENSRLRQQLEEAAVAAERNRIARDLHDSVTQTLFSASLIAEVLPRLWERNEGEARKRVEELRQLTRGALAEMRMLLLELRPATLANVALTDLLKQLAEATGGRSRIPIALSIQGECKLPAAVHNAFYRIAQEALNNVARHSGASMAAMTLSCAPDTVEMSVADNGKGFDPGSVSGQHLGLDIMRERCREVGADLEIGPAGPPLFFGKPSADAGPGTQIFVRWSSDGRGTNGE